MVTVHIFHFMWVIPTMLVLVAANMGLGYAFWHNVTTKGQRQGSVPAVILWFLSFFWLLWGDTYWLPLVFPNFPS